MRLIADGNNVARFGQFPKNSQYKGRFRNLELLSNFCKRKGYDLITLVSPCLKYQIDDRNSFKNLLKENKVIETPAGHDCDHFILESAKQLDRTIVSNDLFRNYKEKYPLVRKQRISFIIVNDTIIIPQLTAIGGENRAKK